MSEVFYPPTGDRHLLLPNGLADVAVDIQRSGIHSPWYLTTLFGNKRIRLKHYDSENQRITLMTGQIIQLNPINPAMKDITKTSQDGEVGMPFGGLSMVNLYQIQDGSFIGKEFVLGDDGFWFKCNVNFGLARLNADGTVLWRKVYMIIADKPDFESSWWGGCSHYKDQRLMYGVDAWELLPDGNFAIRIGINKLVHISSLTGLPYGSVPGLHVVDSEQFLRFKEATNSKLKHFPGHPDYVDSLEDGNAGSEVDVEAEYYRALQTFFETKH